MRVVGTWCSLLMLLLAKVVQAPHPEVDMTPLIVGGTEVPMGAKTYTSGVRRIPEVRNFCGASLITPKHVLTAAHCYGNISYASIGSHFLRGTEDGQRVRVVKQTKHPKYVRLQKGHRYDLLVLELEKEVTNVDPVALAQADGSDTMPGDLATVMGWGRLSEDGERSDVLLSVDVRLLGNEQCQTINELITEDMLCAGGHLNEDSCKGDSGGPLVVSKGGRDVLVGVVSWGNGCGRAGQPGVYARVATAREWIDSVVSGVQWR